MVEQHGLDHAGAMTTTPTDVPPPPPPAGGTGGSGPAPQRDLGRLRRSRSDRHIAGVAGGLAQHFDIDPVIVRVALVVLVFFGGAGLLIYAGCWLFVPEEGREDAVVGLDARSRAVVLYVVAAIAALAVLGDTVGHVHVPWPLLIIAVIALVLLADREGGWFPLVRSPRRRDRAAAAAAAMSQTQARAEGSPYSTVDPPAPPLVTPPPAPRRRDPRKRGPILFGFTVALIALAEGVLGIVDLAGATIAGPAYPALAVGIIGLMLVLGAFWGRAGGLILLGFVASIVLAGSLAADKWHLDGHSQAVTYAPTSAAAVRGTYTHGTGDLRLDLTQVSDPAALAGRDIEVSGHVGSIDVVVPAGLAVDASGRVNGPGQVDVFGESHGGIHTYLHSTQAGSGTPLTINAHLNVGQITVETR